MSSFYDRHEIPDPIFESIEVNAARSCGCHERGEQWWLCQYHVGMMMGWEAFEEAIVSLVNAR